MSNSEESSTVSVNGMHAEYLKLHASADELYQAALAYVTAHEAGMEAYLSGKVPDNSSNAAQMALWGAASKDQAAHAARTEAEPAQPASVWPDSTPDEASR